MNAPLDTDVPANPFPGIEPFSYRDRRAFFARHLEVRALMRLVVLYRGVLVYGPSQRGKSSLMNAGLIPMAMAQGYQPERIRVQCKAGAECVVERIPDGPGSYLPSAFAPDDHQSGEALVVSLAWLDAKVRQLAAAGAPGDPGSPPEALDAGRPRRLLLIFDQFEEWITAFEEAPADAQTDAARLQTAILHAITGLINDHRISVKVVLAFREDYLPQMEPFLLRCPTLGDHYLRLGALSPKRLYKLIRGPFMAYRGRYPREIGPSTAKVIQRQFDDGHGGEVSLTELQIVCRSLFEQPDLATWLKPGEPGVRGILREYFRSRLDVLPERHREPAIALLGALVSGAGTRKTVDSETLLAVVSSETREPRDVCAAALRDLELQARLVRREHRRDMDYLEISSEFLVDWIKEQSAARRDRLKEQRLQDEKARIAARARAEANASAQRRLLRWTAGFAAVCLLFLIAAVTAAAVAVELGNEHVARLWVQAAGGRLERDPEGSLRLALRANAVARENAPAVLLPADMALFRAVRATAHIDSTEKAQAVAAAMSADSRVLAFVETEGRSVEFRGSDPTEAPASRPLAHPGNVQGLAFLRGAEVLVVHRDGAFEIVLPPSALLPGVTRAGATAPPAGWDVQARIVRWALDAERQRLLIVSASAPSQSADGQWHAGRQWVSLADVPAGRWLRHEAVGPDDRVALAANGRVYAVTSGADTVRLHDANGRRIATTRMDGVQSVHPSANGAFVLGIPNRPTAAAVYLWQVTTGQTWRIPLPGSGRVVTALVAPDSRSFAILQTPGLAQAWDLRARGAIHAAPIRATGIAYSDDGSELLTWDDRGAAEAWALGPSERRLRLVGHREPIVGMLGRAGGRVVTLTASTMRTWTRAGREPVLQAPPGDRPVGLAVGRGGHRVVLAAARPSDETSFPSGPRTRIAIRSVPDGATLSELTATGVVAALAYAPTGGRVAAGLDSGRLLVLEDGDDRSRDVALDAPGPITALAFSDDGLLLAYASQAPDKAGIVVVRDLARRVDIATHDLAGLATALRFSADRRRLAVGTFEPGAYTSAARDSSRPGTRFRILVLGDRTRVTNASPAVARPLLAMADGLPGSAPGSRIAGRLTDLPAIAAISAGLDVAVTADAGAPVALWPGLDPGAMRQLAEQASTLAMSSDGRFFATGNLDGAVKLFSADGRLDPVVLQESGSPVAAIAFSPASDHLASVTTDGGITVYPYGRDHMLDLARRVSPEPPTDADCVDAALDVRLCRGGGASWRSVLHRLVPGRK